MVGPLVVAAMSAESTLVYLDVSMLWTIPDTIFRRCQPLWTIVPSVLNFNTYEARLFFQGDVPAILSMRDPSKRKIQAVVLAYRIYNYFRHEVKDHATMLKRNRDLDSLHNLLFEVACAFQRHHY